MYCLKVQVPNMIWDLWWHDQASAHKASNELTESRKRCIYEGAALHEITDGFGKHHAFDVAQIISTALIYLAKDVEIAMLVGTTQQRVQAELERRANSGLLLPGVTVPPGFDPSKRN